MTENPIDNRTAMPEKRRGFIFIYGIIAMSILFVMGTLCLQVASDSWNQAVRTRANVEAMNLAEAAADAGEAYLRSATNAPAKGTTTYYPGPTSSTWVTLPSGQYQAKITTRTNPYNAWYANTYVVWGYGKSSRMPTMQRTVVLSLSPQSFTLYGYFEDTGLSNNWWVSDLSHFQGPFHTNGKLQIDWSKTSSTQIFDSTNVSSTNGAITWGSAGAAKTASDWGKIFTNVPSNGTTPMLTLGSDAIPFPTAATDQQTAAWGSSSGFPSTADVYVNSTNIANAGIYVCSGGKPVTIAFSVDSQNRQVVTFNTQVLSGSTWVPAVHTYTVDLVNNSTILQSQVNGGTVTTTNYTGVPNGVIYSDNSISGLSGQLGDSYVVNSKIVRPNAWTVATDFSSTGQKNVVVTNNITYKHPPILTNPYDPNNLTNLTAPALGVLGYQIQISTACPSTLEIDGVYMATSTSTSGSIVSNDIAAHVLKGQMTIMGGTIVKAASILGQYNSSTKAMVYGYHETYKYDPRMAAGPLRAFPQTNQYGLDSWQWQ